MLGRRGLVLLLLATAVTGCDDAPNPNFQNAISARDAARSGDPYSDLDNGDRRWGLTNYSRSRPSDQLGSAQRTAVALQGKYAGLLSKLDGDAAVKKSASLWGACRPSFDAASQLSGANVIAAADARKVTAELTACRTKALDAEEQGDSTGAPTIKRFASAGMVLVGAATTAKGDRAAGEALWGKAAGLADQDMPGFRVTLDNLRG